MRILLIISIFVLCACDRQWNNPHASEKGDQKILYAVFTSPPKHLDPVRAYNLDEATFVDQIYEPPLEYNYLKRPYELQASTLTRHAKGLNLSSHEKGGG